ncbi:MAG: penicillin-binding protein activator LpoB [Limisphaerales bacterium]
MKNFKKILLAGTAGIACWTLTGCGTPNAKYVDAGGPRTLATVGQINIQDYQAAADAMVNSLIQNVINQGQLQTSNNGRAVLGISRVINNTAEHVDTDLLTKKIRVSLNKTGRVVTTTTYGLGGKGEDPLAQQILRDREKAEGKPLTILPDYSLSGKIIELRASAGRKRQSSHVFQLSLTSNDGLAIWEDEKTITKQGHRRNVGF